MIVGHDRLVDDRLPRIVPGQYLMVEAKDWRDFSPTKASSSWCITKSHDSVQ